MPSCWVRQKIGFFPPFVLFQLVVHHLFFDNTLVLLLLPHFFCSRNASFFGLRQLTILGGLTLPFRCFFFFRAEMPFLTTVLPKHVVGRSFLFSIEGAPAHRSLSAFAPLGVLQKKTAPGGICLLSTVLQKP